MNNLTIKEREIIAKYDITVRKDEHTHDRLCYAFFIGGDFFQQKGFETEYDAYIAGINHVLKKKK